MTPLEQLDIEFRYDFVLARLGGEVDLSNAPAIKQQLFDAVPNTAAALLLDLSDTVYLDSSGIRLIFELATRLATRGQRLELVIPDHSLVKRVLVLTEVDKVVPLSHSVEAVLDA
jgi:anti-sigma B factor antagonist